MAEGGPVRTLLLIVMDLLVVLAVVLVLRIVVEFFGVLAAASWGKAVVTLTRPITIPAGVRPITTPYGGVFDVNAALTVVVLLGIEWAVGVARRAS
jgi:hypothetical protein